MIPFAPQEGSLCEQHAIVSRLISMSKVDPVILLRFRGKRSD